MANVTTIAVKPETKAKYDGLRGKRPHNEFLLEMVAVYGALTTAQRHVILAQAAGAALPPAEIARLLDGQQGA